MSNNYQKHTFDNGLTLITIPMPHVKSATGLLMVGAGSRNESKEINGLSHFLEHMPSKGTRKRPSALAIAEEIDSVGASSNAFTSDEYAGFYVKSASSHLPMIVDLLSDMILNPLLKKEDIEMEKGVIIEEINMYEDMPIWKVSKNFQELLYGDTPLGRQTIGTKENIRKMQRENFLSYLDRWYRPENSVFTVAGGVKEEEVFKLVEEYFGRWEKGKTGQREAVQEAQNKPVLALETKETEQTHLVLGVRAYPRQHPKRYAFSVLTAILGGGMSSRLFHEVREQRGLAYYVKAETVRFNDVGYFAARAGVDKKRIDEAIKVILKEFVKIKTTGVSQKELNKGKEYLKGNLILELEDSFEVASVYATSQLLEGKIRTPEEILHGIDTVNAEEIQAVAQDIFKEDKLNLAIIGPFGDRQRFENLLEL